ncbi:alpha/beta hydrolase [Pseudomonas sp. F1_0610]|uniref:RBBP9/YdeN family alpha/beta hydrolase n=1 Tax=Pseudomonas sp. F1_0610 TaxID=3114284 RepID=UPI0039C2AAC6
MTAKDYQYLIVPGWNGSPENHWQSFWQVQLNARRVEQQNWSLPEVSAWLSQLEYMIASSTAPVILIAHSLGCITVAHWAMQASRFLRSKIQGALLVAPADVERANCPEALQGFAPISLQALPFPSIVVGSLNDPAASAERAAQLAQAWRSEYVQLGEVGHINVASGHHQWQEGFHYLQHLIDMADKRFASIA